MNNSFESWWKARESKEEVKLNLDHPWAEDARAAWDAQQTRVDRYKELYETNSEIANRWLARCVELDHKNKRLLEVLEKIIGYEGITSVKCKDIAREALELSKPSNDSQTR